MTGSTVLLFTLFLSTIPKAEVTFKPAVFVTIAPDAHELSGNKREELTDSARDLREQLEKRSGLTVVEERAAADVVVIILDRRLEVSRAGETNYGGGSVQTHYQSRHVLSFRLQAAGSVQDSESSLAGAFVTWKRVAGALAKDIEAWTSEHREALLGPDPR